MNIHRARYTSCCFKVLNILLLLMAIQSPVAALAESNVSSETPVKTNSESFPGYLQMIQNNTAALQNVAVQLRGMRETVDGKLADIGRNTEIGSTLDELNKMQEQVIKPVPAADISNSAIVIRYSSVGSVSVST